MLGIVRIQRIDAEMAGAERDDTTHGGMTRLTETLQTLGLEGEINLSGRWVRLQGGRFPVYVAEAAWDAGYYTWCDDSKERAVEFYLDPTEAIQAGLQRAA